MYGGNRPNPAFYWALSFIIGTPILISIILIWIGFERMAEFEAAQRDVGSSTIKLVAEDIRSVIENNTRLVNIYAEINNARITELARHPDNTELFAAIQRDLQRWFPNMFAYTISNHDGHPFLEDFDGYVGELCIEDLRNLATHNIYTIRLHPNPHAYHYDVMGKWGDATFGGIFFVSFKPETIVRRLVAASPPGHQLALIIKDREYMLEISEAGSREKTPREDYRMKPEEKARILDMIPIENTEWDLVDMSEPDLFPEFRQRLISTYGAIIAVFLLGSIMISALLIYFEKQRRAASRMRDEMMSLFSHDLRSPLVSILGAIGLLKDRHKMNGDDTRKMLELTYENAKTMTRIVNDIMDIHRLDSGKMDFDFNKLELNAVCHKACEINQAYAREFSVSLVEDISEDVIKVKADEQRLIQALTNLISNAIKYSYENGTVTLRCHGKNQNAIIAIEDQGVGIPKAFHREIFEKFTQTKQPLRKKVASTGLGLAIVKSIVTAHGGRIHFTSKEGVGTTFYIELPLAE